MTLTREFRTTLQERAQRDSAFRQAMLTEGVEAMLSGDTHTGRAVLRDYINASIGFVELAEVTHIPAKSLMRMFGANGNPRADNLFQVIHHLQTHEGVHLGITAHP